jgi:hypothetical protein
VLEQVWRDGARLDSWDEHFSFERWTGAFDKCGLDPAFFANRERARGEMLPWSAVSAGVSVEYLWSEREASLTGEVTPDCRARCTGCGASELIAPLPCDCDMGDG